MPTLQKLSLGSLAQARPAPGDTMFANTGRRLYVIGDIDGRFRPRSNPYDLHAYGKPRPDDPLAGRLQGIWAQPVRGLAGYAVRIETASARWTLEDAHTFTQTFASAIFDFQNGDLAARREDFCALDLPCLFSRLQVTNHGSLPLVGRLVFTAIFDLQDAWFTRLAASRNQGEQVSTAPGGVLLAQANSAPERWAAAVGSRPQPQQVHILPSGSDGSPAEMIFDLHLPPGERGEWWFAAAIESETGTTGTLACLQRALPEAERLLAEKQAFYLACLERGTRLISPDPAFNTAFDLARLNLQMLEAAPPALGLKNADGITPADGRLSADSRHFYAGLEMFPFWFSNDGAYSLPGMMIAGMAETALNHLRLGARFAQNASVPHQVSPAGHVIFPGNAEETPLWVTGVWEAYRWTGDRAFLAELYPAAYTGLFEHCLAAIDPDGDGYPSGPGMVEAEGMGAEKLDSAVYLWQALHSLAQMAVVQADEPTRHRALQAAQKIASRFEQDWWDEAAGTYAMSLDDANRQVNVPHWAVITPLEVGLASSEHAARTFATVRAHYLNRWGMKHTAGHDERIWTLPTAALSRAAFRYGDPALGFDLLSRIPQTLAHGAIGMFHELIPEGACFIQLWSAAAFLRGVVEDLLGVRVDAASGQVTASPCLPPAWDLVRLDNLPVGERSVSLVLNRTAG